MPNLPDNRMRFPAPEINFVDDVGTTGQDHDNFPAPGQARYDWMRLAIISLLSQQSSYREPTQKRIGTPWFDLNTEKLKMWNGISWANIADFIEVNGDMSLTEWITSINDGIVDALITNEDIQAAVNMILTDESVFLTVEDEDDSVSVPKVTKIVVPTGTLVNLGGGVVTLSMQHETILINGFHWRDYGIGPHWNNYTWGGGTPIITMAFDDAQIEGVVAEDFIKGGSGSVFLRIHYLNTAPAPSNARLVLSLGAANAGDTRHTRANVAVRIAVDNSDTLAYVDVEVPEGLVNIMQPYSNFQVIAYRDPNHVDDTMVGDFQVIDMLPRQIIGSVVP